MFKINVITLLGLAFFAGAVIPSEIWAADSQVKPSPAVPIVIVEEPKAKVPPVAPPPIPDENSSADSASKTPSALPVIIQSPAPGYHRALVHPEYPLWADADLKVPTAAPLIIPVKQAGTDLKTALAHHNFVLESVDGREFTYAVPEGMEMVKPNLSFGEWPHASGKICNNFRGQVELNGDTLVMKDAASTMMLCFAEEVNKFEGLFHQLLREGVKVKVEGQTLTLTGGGHVLVFKLRDYVS